jgi:hypothetical protein
LHCLATLLLSESLHPAAARSIGSHLYKTKPHRITCGVLRNKSLTMTYFHRRPSTIIGAKAFHCPVRDGKEWYHLAMVVRRNGLSGCGLTQRLQSWKKHNVWVTRGKLDDHAQGVCNWCWLAADGAARFCIERHLERYITRSITISVIGSSLTSN